MSRTKAMLAAEVIMSDEYNGLSFEGRDAYVLLNCFTDAGGRIDNPSFVLRGRGLDPETLDELRDAGFVLTIGREHFIVDFWLANERRDRFTQLTKNTMAFQSGRLGFEGEPFKSRFVDLGGSTGQVRDKYGTYPEEVQTKATQRNTKQTNANSSSKANASTVLVPNDGGISMSESDELALTTCVNKCVAYGYDRDEMRQWLLVQYEQGGVDAMCDAAQKCIDSAQHDDGFATSSEVLPF